MYRERITHTRPPLSARPSHPVAIVTGANRGIGFEVSRQLGKAGMRVIMAARDAEKGEAAARQLVSEGLTAEPLELDVTDRARI